MARCTSCRRKQKKCKCHKGTHVQQNTKVSVNVNTARRTKRASNSTPYRAHGPQVIYISTPQQSPMYPQMPPMVSPGMPPMYPTPPQPQYSNHYHDTPIDEIKLHTLCLACGGRGSGKPVAIMSKLKDLQDAGFCDRLFILSPTLGSNKSILQRIKYSENDCFSEPSKESLLRIIEAIEQEAVEWDEFLVKQRKWRKAMRMLGRRRRNDPFAPEVTNASLSDTNELEEPQSKYGHRPCIHLLIDDCQGTPVFSTSHKSPFINLCLRHRHVGRGLGVSLWIACQTYKSQGGLPRSVRENCTHLLLFRTKNLKSIDQIGEEIGDVVGLNEFNRAYRYSTREEHSFLFIDFSPKEPKYRFRKRFDTLILFQADVTDGSREIHS